MFHNVETSGFINNIEINQTKKESDFLFSSVSINYRNKYYYNVKMHSCFSPSYCPSRSSLHNKIP